MANRKKRIDWIGWWLLTHRGLKIWIDATRELVSYIGSILFKSGGKSGGK